MSWENSAYTTAGARLLLDSINGTRLTITRAVSGTSVVDTALLPQQTDVAGQPHTLELMGMETVGAGDDTARRIRIRITGAESSHVIHQIGLYGRLDGAEEDTLLMLYQDDHGAEVPAASSDHEFEIIFTAAFSISREAKIALALTADLYGLKRFLRKEIHNNTAHVKLLELTITAEGWVQENSEAEYGYALEVPIEGLTAEQSPHVTIHKESFATAQKAGVCTESETLDTGVLKLWAKQPPDTDITATLQLISPQSMDTLSELLDETAVLGDAVVGNAIVGM